MFKGLKLFIFPAVCIFVICIFIFIFSQNSSILIKPGIPNRDIIILLEDGSSENISKTLNSRPGYGFTPTPPPVGIGAMTANFLLALYEKAKPIVVNKSLVKNVIEHKTIFKDFTTRSYEFLHQKYSKYKRFRNQSSILQFKKHCSYMFNKYAKIKSELNKYINNKKIKNKHEIFEKIFSNQEFDISNAPKSLKKFTKGQFTSLDFTEMVIYMFCYLTPTDNDTWFIKKVSDDLYLFIPKEYLKKIGIQGNTKYIENTEITQLEEDLGLKLNHLEDINDLNINLIQKTSDKKNTIIKDLSRLFITKEDKVKNNAIWAIYLSGHGFPITPAKCLLTQLQKLEEYYQKEMMCDKFKKCKEIENSEDYIIYYDHINSCKTHQIYEEYSRNLENIKSEILHIQNIIKKATTIQNGIIASLSLEEFQNFILFLNNQINTVFLFYTSCFSGGELLIKPYQKDGKPLILNYHIVSGTLAENVALQEMPYIALPPYYKTYTENGIKINGIEENDIDWSNKDLSLKISLNYKKFFKTLHNGLHCNLKNLPSIIFNLHPYSQKPSKKLCYDCLGNIPSVRPANSDSFSIIPNDSLIVSINDNLVKEESKELSIPPNSAALLYTKNISKPIIFERRKHKIIPPFISMLPGLAVHTFQEIKAPKFKLIDIVKSFFSFPELSASKIFWIKKLECSPSEEVLEYLNFHHKKQTSITLNDVVVVRNILSTDKLQNREPNKPPIDTCVFVSSDKDSEQSFKMVLDSYEMHGPNFFTESCTSKYKTELLAYDERLIQENKPNLA